MHVSVQMCLKVEPNTFMYHFKFKLIWWHYMELLELIFRPSKIDFIHGPKLNSPLILQYALLNGITVNGISGLLGSDFIRFHRSNLIFITIWKWPVNVIDLMGSYIAWPKVIPLGSAYCYKNCQIWANFKIFHFIKSLPLKNVCLAIASRKSLQCNQTIIIPKPRLDVFLMCK
jgi:hypothetical protein